MAQESFADIIEAGRKNIPESGYAFEVPNIFGKTPVPALPKDLQSGGIGYDYHCNSHSKVFVIWCPWRECARCVEDFQQSRIVLPPDGDYECPHVQSREFKEIKDKCLRGEALREREEYFNLKGGERCVHFSWIEEDEEFKRRVAAQEKAKEDTRVWPPNLARAFADTPAEAKELAESPDHDPANIPIAAPDDGDSSEPD